MQTEVKKNKYSEITNWHFFKKTKEKESELLSLTPTPFKFFWYFFLSILLTHLENS